MLEMLKSKSIIALCIMILGVSYLSACDTKKADTVKDAQRVDQTIYLNK